jgi:hypothetical protein
VLVRRLVVTPDSRYAANMGCMFTGSAVRRMSIGRYRSEKTDVGLPFPTAGTHRASRPRAAAVIA